MSYLQTPIFEGASRCFASLSIARNYKFFQAHIEYTDTGVIYSAITTNHWKENLISYIKKMWAVGMKSSNYNKIIEIFDL